MVRTMATNSKAWVVDLSEKINSVVKFTDDERMSLNLGKCKEMVIDFCKNKSDIPPLEINGYVQIIGFVD